MTPDDSLEAPVPPARTASGNGEAPTPSPVTAPVALPPVPVPAAETSFQTDAGQEGFQFLDPKVVRLQRTIGWIVVGWISFVLLAVFVPLFVFSSMLDWVKVLLGIVLPLLMAGLGVLLHRWPAIEHRHSRYRVDGQAIEIQRGVVWRSAVLVPRSRVQHLDVSQGPIERALGLGTLVLYTAGTDHARVSLSGLSHPTALALRDRLLPGDGDDAV